MSGAGYYPAHVTDVAGEVIWEPGKEDSAERAVKAMADDLITQIREARVAIEAGS